MVFSLSCHKTAVINGDTPPDATHDFKILREYVLNQTENIWLDLLHEELRKNDYYYLRENKNRFSSYYGYFWDAKSRKEARVQTNAGYAEFERMLSTQLMLNLGRASQRQSMDSKQLGQRVEKLCKQFPMNRREGHYPCSFLFGPSRTANTFRKHGLDKGIEQLETTLQKYRSQ